MRHVTFGATFCRTNWDALRLKTFFAFGSGSTGAMMERSPAARPVRVPQRSPSMARVAPPSVGRDAGQRRRADAPPEMRGAAGRARAGRRSLASACATARRPRADEDAWEIWRRLWANWGCRRFLIAFRKRAGRNKAGLLQRGFALPRHYLDSVSIRVGKL